MWSGVYRAAPGTGRPGTVRPGPDVTIDNGAGRKAAARRTISTTAARRQSLSACLSACLPPRRVLVLSVLRPSTAVGRYFALSIRNAGACYVRSDDKARVSFGLDV